MAFADEVTVLRKGQFVGSGIVSELKVAQMAEMMVGSEVTAKPKQRHAPPAKTPKLAIHDLRVHDERGRSRSRAACHHPFR